MLSESELTYLHKIYAEICCSYSVYKLNDQDCFVKHRGLIDDLLTDTLYTNELEKLKQKQVFTESEKLNFLIKNELWDKKKEDQIVYTQETLKDLYLNKRKVFRPADIEFYRNQIIENENFLNKVLGEKLNLLGETAEVLARRAADLLLIKKSFFRDSELKVSFYTDEEFEDLSPAETDSLFLLYNKFQNDVSEKNIKKIAVQRFFHDLFFLAAENLFNFFGVAFVRLTHNQSRLLVWGQFFRTILENESIPDQYKDDPDQLSDWYNGKQNITQVIEKQESESGIVSLVGVSKDTLKLYGIENPAAQANNSKMENKFKEKAASGSRELSAQEMLDAGLI